MQEILLAFNQGFWLIFHMEFHVSIPGLVDVMDKLIQQEINNVCDQKEIVLAKLNLYDKLNKEYEEQRKLISQQVRYMIKIIFISRNCTKKIMA